MSLRATSNPNRHQWLPDLFAWATALSRHQQDLVGARRQMWLARRLVYLAASRANVFLYFILPPDLDSDLRPEFAELFRQLSQPPPQWATAGKRWELRILQTPESEKLAVYLDLTEGAPPQQSAAPTAVSPPEAPSPAPIPAPAPLPPQKSEAPAASPAGPTAVSAAPNPAPVQPAKVPPAHQAVTSPAPKPAQPATVTAPKLATASAQATQPTQPQPLPGHPPAPQPAKEPTRVTVAQLAKRIGLPVHVALEALRSRGFPVRKDNTVVNATIAEHLRTTKAEYDRQRPLQTIQFPEPKPSQSESITDFIRQATDQPPQTNS
jgi:hypothetical protein